MIPNKDLKHVKGSEWKEGTIIKDVSFYRNHQNIHQVHSSAWEQFLNIKPIRPDQKWEYAVFDEQNNTWLVMFLPDHVRNEKIAREIASCFVPDEDQPKRPPIGIEPRYIWEAKRLNDLSECIKRYLDSGFPVSTRWISEYNELLERSNDTK